MIDISLVTVNWNNRPCTELLLKSYIKYHYKGKPLKLILFDNGSTDDSKQFLRENQIPFIDGQVNLGHENALNYIFKDIDAHWVQLCDTDFMFEAETHSYIQSLEKRFYVSWGEYIDNQYYEQIKIRNRVGPWFWCFDYKWVRKFGIEYFRDPNCQDWTFDVGSWLTMKMEEHSTEGHMPMKRAGGDQDRDLISMVYPGIGSHIGKCSWSLDDHQDRFDEIIKRNSFVISKLEEFKEIDLKGKFISGLKNNL